MEQLIDLLPLDVFTDGGAYYPLSVVEEAAYDFNKRIEARNGTMGECNVPDIKDWQGPPETRYMQIDLSRVSHIVRNMWIDGGYLRCKVFLLGKYAELARELNFDYLGIPRATGATNEQGVCTKYTLITVDLSLPELT